MAMPLSKVIPPMLAKNIPHQPLIAEAHTPKHCPETSHGPTGLQSSQGQLVEVTHLTTLDHWTSRAQ